MLWENFGVFKKSHLILKGKSLWENFTILEKIANVEKTHKNLRGGFNFPQVRLDVQKMKMCFSLKAKLLWENISFCDKNLMFLYV